MFTNESRSYRTNGSWILKSITGYWLELTTLADLVLMGGAYQIMTRYQRTPGQGCHCGSSTIHMQLSLHISNLPGGKGGGQRPVISLKGLNNFMITEHFKMEGLLSYQT